MAIYWNQPLLRCEVLVNCSCMFVCVFVARQCGWKKQRLGHYGGKGQWHGMARQFHPSTTQNFCVTLSSLWYFEEKKSTIYLACFFAMEYFPYIIKDKFFHKLYSTINHLPCFPYFWFCEETLEIIPEPEFESMENKMYLCVFLI